MEEEQLDVRRDVRGGNKSIEHNDIHVSQYVLVSVLGARWDVSPRRPCLSGKGGVEGDSNSRQGVSLDVEVDGGEISVLGEVGRSSEALVGSEREHQAARVELGAVGFQHVDHRHSPVNKHFGVIGQVRVVDGGVSRGESGVSNGQDVGVGRHDGNREQDSTREVVDSPLEDLN